jgi:hypothetical protein
MMWLRSGALLLMFSLAGCTWVTLSPQGETVLITTMDQVGHCKRVGKTTVSTLAKLAGMDRHQESMQDELNKLARNSAADLGGDTAVPISEVEEGRQVYAVFDCRGVAQ